VRSKQLNFFIAPDEYREVKNFLSEEKVLIFPSRRDEILLDNSDMIIHRKSILQIYLTTNHFEKDVHYKYVENRNYYYIDIVKSDVIEFDLGGFYPDSYKDYYSGRLYVIGKYFENRMAVSKPEEFIAWSNNLFKKFKRKFLKKIDPLSLRYTSANFDDWVKKNGATLSRDGSTYTLQ
jgi:hypothetical protein